MDRSTFILVCLLGVGIALAVLLLLGSARRARISLLGWWSCLVFGAVVCLYGLSHSTAPSFAARDTAVGKTSAFVEQRVGRNSKFVFEMSLKDKIPFFLETHLIVPHWDNAEVFEGRTLQVTYLKDATRSVSNEAIDIKILSGEDAGWHDSLDARPAGVWLMIPAGAAVWGFGYIGLRFRKGDRKTGLGAVDA